MKKDFKVPHMKHERRHSVVEALYGNLGEDAARIAAEDFANRSKTMNKKIREILNKRSEDDSIVSVLIEFACKEAKNTVELIMICMSIGRFVEMEHKRIEAQMIMKSIFSEIIKKLKE